MLKVDQNGPNRLRSQRSIITVVVVADMIVLLVAGAAAVREVVVVVVVVVAIQPLMIEGNNAARMIINKRFSRNWFCTPKL